MLLTFADLQGRLLDHLRLRVRNGSLTERGLARNLGVSQPHIHNILKGVRTLSPELGDRILVHLRISLTQFMTFPDVSRPDLPPHPVPSYLPVLSEPVGPEYQWSSRIDQLSLFLIDQSEIATMASPIFCRIGRDARMSPILRSGDYGLMDQDWKVRKNPEPSGLYVIRVADRALIRRVRRGMDRVIYLATEDCLSSPSSWQKLCLPDTDLLDVIRARLFLVKADPCRQLDGHSPMFCPGV